MLQPSFPLSAELGGHLAVQPASAQTARLHLLSNYYVPSTLLCIADEQMRKRKCLPLRSLQAVRADQSVGRGIHQVGAQQREEQRERRCQLFTALPGSPSGSFFGILLLAFLSTRVPILVLETCQDSGIPHSSLMLEAQHSAGINFPSAACYLGF